MRKLRKKRIAKQYGIKFQKENHKNFPYWIFKCSLRGSKAFYLGNDVMFLFVLKNKNLWFHPEFNNQLRGLRSKSIYIKKECSNEKN